MMNNYFQSLAAPNQSDPVANGPGGNPIVPTPATPNEWPKMLLAMAVVSGGLWALSTFSEQYATYLAIFIVLGMVTYYETHGNKSFSQGIKDVVSVIPGW
jgi:hypothetical protein